MKAMKIGIIFFACILASAEGYTQSVLMEQDVNEDTVLSDFGPNRKNYVATYVSFGTIIGNTSEGDSIPELRKGKSLAADYGVYYKRKISELYSLVLNFGYRLEVYSMATMETQKYNRLVMSNSHLDLMNRINLHKRGNIIGKYIEFGPSVDLNYVNKLKVGRETKDEANSEYSFSKEVFRGLDYINRINYSIEGRLGIDKWAVYGKYRLSEVIKSEKGFQLPPVVIGVRLDFGG